MYIQENNIKLRADSTKNDRGHRVNAYTGLLSFFPIPNWCGRC